MIAVTVKHPQHHARSRTHNGCPVCKATALVGVVRLAALNRRGTSLIAISSLLGAARFEIAPPAVPDSPRSRHTPTDIQGVGLGPQFRNRRPDPSAQDLPMRPQSPANRCAAGTILATQTRGARGLSLAGGPAGVSGGPNVGGATLHSVYLDMSFSIERVLETCYCPRLLAPA